LYVIFEVANEGREEIELSRAYVTLRGDRQAVLVEDLEGERTPPTTLAPHDSLRLWRRARELAGRLDAAGHGGTPRLVFVVEDGAGRSYEHSFRFRARQYLDLRDE
jgi:hypothetical protein